MTELTIIVVAVIVSTLNVWFMASKLRRSWWLDDGIDDILFLTTAYLMSVLVSVAESALVLYILECHK